MTLKETSLKGKTSNDFCVKPIGKHLQKLVYNVYLYSKLQNPKTRADLSTTAKRELAHPDFAHLTSSKIKK